MSGTSLQTQIGNNKLYNDDVLSTVGINYVVCAGSSANALVATFQDIAGNNILYTAGQTFFLKTDTTLQAGANTLNVNAQGAKNLVGIGGRNLKTTTASGAILLTVYDGTNFQVLNGTY